MVTQLEGMWSGEDVEMNKRLKIKDMKGKWTDNLIMFDTKMSKWVHESLDL